MDCATCLELLSDYRDARLADRRMTRRLETHLRQCLPCRTRLEIIDHGLGTLRDLAPPVPSPDFRDRLATRLAAEVSLGDPVRPTNAGLAAAFLMAAAVGLFVYEGIRPSPEVAVAAEPVESTAVRLDLAEGPAPADTLDVTLPAFAHTTLEFHFQQAPLGAFASLGR